MTSICIDSEKTKRDRKAIDKCYEMVEVVNAHAFNRFAEFLLTREAERRARKIEKREVVEYRKRKKEASSLATSGVNLEV